MNTRYAAIRSDAGAAVAVRHIINPFSHATPLAPPLDTARINLTPAPPQSNPPPPNIGLGRRICAAFALALTMTGMATVTAPAAAAQTTISQTLESQSTRASLRTRSVVTPLPAKEVQARLDQFMARSNHLYDIKDAEGKPLLDADGRPVQVRVKPAFRITGGMNQAPPEVVRARIRAEFGARVLASDAGMARAIDGLSYGRATPETIARVTQALIDRGKLPTDAGLTPQQRVRKMMWDYGIGLDCAGYVSQAAAAGADRTPQEMGTSIPETVAHGLRLAGNPMWQRVPQLKGQAPVAAAGDVMRLKDRSGDVGHWVTVYDHHVMTQAESKRLISRTSDDLSSLFFFFYNGTVPVTKMTPSGRPTCVTSAIADPGAIHVYTVDSSWGASGDWSNEGGGVNRNTWLYNSVDGGWALLQDGHVYGTDGPYGHDLVGVFRPLPAASHSPLTARVTAPDPRRFP